MVKLPFHLFRNIDFKTVPGAPLTPRYFYSADGLSSLDLNLNIQATYLRADLLVVCIYIGVVLLLSCDVPNIPKT